MTTDWIIISSRKVVDALKEEFINLIKLGVTMCVLAALMIIATYNVLLGKDVGGRVEESFQRINVDAQIGTLKEIEGVETLLPAATTLAFIEYNKTNMGTVTCYLCDRDYGLITPVEKKSCLMSHLNGYVSVLIEKDPVTGLYNLTMRPLAD